MPNESIITLSILCCTVVIMHFFVFCKAIGRKFWLIAEYVSLALVSLSIIFYLADSRIILVRTELKFAQKYFKTNHEHTKIVASFRRDLFHSYVRTISPNHTDWELKENYNKAENWFSEAYNALDKGIQAPDWMIFFEKKRDDILSENSHIKTHQTEFIESFSDLIESKKEVDTLEAKMTLTNTEKTLKVLYPWLFAIAIGIAFGGVTAKWRGLTEN
ncbi:hypothetical protein ACFL5K_03815 [Gemmatimonadota bacterium]